MPTRSTGAAASAPGRDLVAGEWVRPLPFQHHMSARPTPLEASSGHGRVAARSRQWSGLSQPKSPQSLQVEAGKSQLGNPNILFNCPHLWMDQQVRDHFYLYFYLYMSLHMFMLGFTRKKVLSHVLSFDWFFKTLGGDIIPFYRWKAWFFRDGRWLTPSQTLGKWQSWHTDPSIFIPDSHVFPEYFTACLCCVYMHMYMYVCTHTNHFV